MTDTSDSPPSPATLRRARWICAATGAWGVITGFALFVPLLRLTSEGSGDSVVKFLLIFLGALVVVALIEWLREIIGGTLRTARPLPKVILSIALLGVFELCVLAYEEVFETGFERPYVLSEIAGKVAGRQKPLPFYRPEEVLQPESFLAVLRDAIESREATPATRVLGRLADETLWAIAPQIIPRPPRHDRFMDAVARSRPAGAPGAPAELTSCEIETLQGRASAPSYPGIDLCRWPLTPPIDGVALRGWLDSAAPPDTTTSFWDWTRLAGDSLAIGPDSVNRALTAEERESYLALRRKVQALQRVRLERMAGEPPEAMYVPSVDPTPDSVADHERTTSGMGAAELRAFLAQELNGLVVSPGLYHPDYFAEVAAAPGTRELLQQDRDAAVHYWRASNRLELEPGDEHAREQLGAAGRQLLPYSRVIQLNRELMDASFRPFLTAAVPWNDGRMRDLAVLAVLWTLSGGLLGWALSRVFRGATGGALRGALRGGLAALTAAPVGVIGYVFVVRLVSSVADIARGRLTNGATYFLPGEPTLGSVVVGRLRAVGSLWPWALAALAVGLLATGAWIRRRAGRRPAWRRLSRMTLVFVFAAVGSACLYALLDMNVLFVALVVALVWLVPAVFLGASAPFLRTGSALPRVWGWRAVIVGAVLVLITAARLYWREIPWWPALPGIMLILTGALAVRERRVEDYWPLAALTIAMTAGGTTALVQNATFHGLLADVHALNVPTGSYFQFWRRTPARPPEPAPAELEPREEPWNPYAAIEARLRYDPATIDRPPATSTGDAELDQRVRAGEEADREWLRRERGVVAAQLELVLVGSLGFWVTIGLLAGWSLVLPPRKHDEPAAGAA